MGIVIQAESRTIELASIYMKEFDRSVLGYWDQPAHKVDLIYYSGEKRIRVQVTLDFFVVSEDFIGFEECKPVEQLDKLCEKSPNRYRYNEETGKYEIPPLDEYLEGTGIGYRVFTDRNINKQYVENLAFLYDFAGEPCGQEYKEGLSTLKELLETLGSVSISEIVRRLPFISREEVFKAIVEGELVADMEGASFNEPERMHVATTHRELKTTVNDESSINVQNIPHGSPAEIKEALRRYKIILPLLLNVARAEEVATTVGVSKRTLCRWKKAYDEDGGLDGLSPAHRRKGNRNSKVPLRAEVLMSEFIDTYYMSKSNKKPSHIYNLMKEKCESEGLAAPSKKTFYGRLSVLSVTKSSKVREGAKSAYQTTAYRGLSDVDTGVPFREVTRFLERCHIDHTLMDLELVDDDGVNLGKPWLTVVVDEYSSCILAYYLSFDSPSVVSLMCVIRLMVVAHEVMPEAVVVDGGKEFESTYFEKLMAKYNCAIVSRKGKPRGGGAIERFFGALDSMATHNLTGNTTLTKNVRKLSASHNPKVLAVWGAYELHDGLKEIFEYYNSSFPIRDTKPPYLLRDKSMGVSGRRASRSVKYSDEFYMDTLPEPKRHMARLRRNKHIQVNRVSYWHSSFRTVRHGGESVSLRYDPFNLNHVYIFYKNEWIRCRAVNQQHRKASDLDGAFLAEIKKRMLFLNEKAKEEARVGMAKLVERLDEEQTANPRSISPLDADNDKIGSQVASVNGESDMAEDEDVWNIEIPGSSRSDD